MPTELPSDVTTAYLSQGVLGITCVVLSLVVLKLWAEIKAERAAHKIEVAAKDALINDLQDERLAEARAGFDVAKQTEKTLDAFLLAVRGKGLQ